MRLRHLFVCLGLIILPGFTNPKAAGTPANVQTFDAAGVVMALPSDRKTVVIRHGAISNYMAAMTMPFPVKQANELAALHAGDNITFRLHVTENESWIDGIKKTGNTDLSPPTEKPVVETGPVHSRHPLLDYKFTNELGQAVSLNDYRGQALAITFFYTRCPLPEYCPRLSKNFQEASEKLEAMPDAPTNWHFLSFSFDTTFDTPATLKAYGDSYQYDSNHWSLLTGPADKIGELASESGVSYQLNDGTFNHNFRTLIVDASGHLQTVFPITGDLSDQIVSEILKATATTNSLVTAKLNH